MFTQNSKVSSRTFNIDTAIELHGYLDQLAPEAPKVSASVSYMAKITINPKPSAITSYLDTVSGATPKPVVTPEYYPPYAPTYPAVSSEPAYSSRSVGTYKRYSSKNQRKDSKITIINLSFLQYRDNKANIFGGTKCRQGA